MKLIYDTHSMQRWLCELYCNCLVDFTRFIIVLEININYVK